MGYRGATERGRFVTEDSLQECVKSLAHVANKQPDQVITHQLTKTTWLVYEDQAALDVDLTRGEIAAESPGWFAFIEAS